jgi:hypothetical protein
VFPFVVALVAGLLPVMKTGHRRRAEGASGKGERSLSFSPIRKSSDLFAFSAWTKSAHALRDFRTPSARRL